MFEFFFFAFLEKADDVFGFREELVANDFNLFCGNPRKRTNKQAVAGSVLIAFGYIIFALMVSYFNVMG